MLVEQLQTLGLHKNEIVVYMTLFDLGKCRASQIIKSTGLHRNLVYTSLEALVAKKLVSQAESGKVFIFAANHPGSLIEMIELQKNIAIEAAASLTKKQTETPRDIKIYEGADGLLTARERSLALPVGDVVYVMGGSHLTSTAQLDKQWLSYHKKRIKKKINCRLLFDRTVDPQYVAGRAALPYTEAKFMPFNVDLPAMFDMYGDTLAITVPGIDPITFSVSSAPAADSLKKYFDYFWNQEVVTETGVEALQRTFYTMLDELKAGEEYYVIGAATNTYNDENKNSATNDFYNKYHTDRIKKDVTVKMLAYREYVARGKQRFSDCGDTQHKISFIKPFISMPRIPMQINLYKGKTILILYGDNPTVLRFNRPEIYAGFKAYFDSSWNQESYVLRGGEALRDLWLEGTATGEVRWIGARGYFIDNFPEYFREIENASRAKSGLVWKNIVDRSVSGHAVTKFPWSQTRYTSIKTHNPNVTWLFGNKMVISNWVESEPVLFVSENKHLVQSQNDYFEELWSSLPT